MVNGAKLDRVAPDIRIGQMQEAGLTAQVSVRGGQIIVGYAKDGRGFSVTFSPSALARFVEMQQEAVEVANGRG